MKNKIVLAAVFGLALLLRIFLIMQFPIMELADGDERNFDTIAVGLTQGKSLLEPWAERPPLYVFLLSAIYHIFGHNYFVARIFQAIIGAFTAIVLYLLARDIFDHKVAVISAIVFAIYPIFIAICRTLLAEPLYIFLLCLAVYILNKTINEESFSKMIVSGILMGLATLAKPLPLFYPFFLIIVLFLIYRKLGQTILHWVIFTLSMAVVIAPWSYRNYLVFNTFLPVSTNGGFNMWAGSYPPWGGKYLGGHTEPLKSYIAQAYKNNLNYVQIDKMLYDKAFANIASNPVGYFKLCARKILFLFQNTGNDLLGLKSFYSYNYYELQFWFLLLMYFVSIALPVLTIFSFILEPSQWRKRVVTFSIILYTSCLLLASTPGPRYILPVMSLMLIFAVYVVLNLHLFVKRNGAKGI